MSEATLITTILAALGAFIFVFALLIIAYAIFAIIGYWKLFEKAGQPGWKAIIPFYSTYTLVEIAGLNWYWFLLAIAPTILSFIGNTALSSLGGIAVVFANVMIAYNLAKKLHKDTAWIVLAVIFGAFVIPIAGYSKNTTYDKEAVVTPNAFFDKN